jgi:hypothetical protein
MTAPLPDIYRDESDVDCESQTRRIVRSDENTLARLERDRETVARGAAADSVTKLRDTRGMERWEKAEPETLTNIKFPKDSADLDFGAVVIPVSQPPVHVESSQPGPVLLPPPSMPPRKRNSSGRGVSPSVGVQPSPLRQLQEHRAKRRAAITLDSDDSTDTRCRPSQIRQQPRALHRAKPQRQQPPQRRAPQPKARPKTKEREAPARTPEQFEPQPRPVARPRPAAEAYAPSKPQTWAQPKPPLHPPQAVMRQPRPVSSISMIPPSQAPLSRAPQSQPAPSSRPPSVRRPRLLSAEMSYAGLRAAMPPTPPQRGMRWPTWVAALACTWLAVVALVVAFALLIAPARTELKAKAGIAAALPEFRESPAAALTAALTGSLRISTSQKGVRAALDGVDRGKLPLTMKELTPGQHFLRLHGNAQQQPIERTLMIEAGRTLHLSDVRLTTIQSDGDEDAEAAIAKRKAALLQAATDAANRRDAVRREAHRRAVERIEARKSAAKAKTKAKAKKAKLAAKKKVRALARKKARDAKRAEAKEAKLAAAKSQDVSATGTLNINSLPQSRAFVDGRSIGNTPIMGMKVAVGAHTITFVHPKHGRKSVSVRVSEEKAAVAVHRFK